MNFSDLIGKPLTESIEKQLRSFGDIRIKRPGFMYTQDFKPSRINIVVDKNNIVTHVGNG